MLRFLCLLSSLLALPSYAQATVEFTWLGVAGFALNDGETNIVFDPFVSRPSIFKLLSFATTPPKKELVTDVFKRWGITKTDAVFVSHAHFDHAMDAPTVVREFGGKLYGSSSTMNIGLGHGLKPEQMNQVEIGASYQIGKFNILVFSSPHPPIFFNWNFAPGNIQKPLSEKATMWDYKCGDSYGFYIIHPEGTFVFQQTSRLPEVDPLEGKKTQFLFQTIANRTSSADIVRDRIQKMDAKVIIPLHYDDFFQELPESGPAPHLPFVNVDEFKQTLKEMSPETKLLMPNPGETVKLEL